MKTLAITAAFTVLSFFCFDRAIQAQTTAFTYQGKLADGSSPRSFPTRTSVKFFGGSRPATFISSKQTASSPASIH